MKKLLALILAMIMMLSLVACNSDDKETNTDDENKESIENNESDSESEEEEKEEELPDTFGYKLYADFKSRVDAKADATALELAEGVIANELVLFFGGAMAIEEGYLSGFDNYEVKGFKEGAMFGPMMGSIPFIGYIFKLEDGADVDAFMKTLEENCNPRWQICVAAEETIIKNIGNTVFFLMSPISNEG